MARSNGRKQIKIVSLLVLLFTLVGCDCGCDNGPVTMKCYSGGTGYAVRCAIDYGIPTYNLNNSKEMQDFVKLLRNL